MNPTTPACFSLMMSARESAKKMVGPALPLIWQEQAEQMRDELGHKTTPLLERMLIEHVVLCCFRLTMAGLAFSSVMAHGGTLAQIEHQQKRVGAAQRRFVRVSESLAKVRRL